MSYCVNCGVKLDPSLKECPLCHTGVFNPNEPYNEMTPSSFPSENGQVDVVKRGDLVILLTVILLSTAIGCGLINFLFYNKSMWSIVIIGLCFILWVFFIPAMIYTKLSVYLTLLFDGLIVCTYLWGLTFMTKSNHWFLYIALPIVLLLIVLCELMAFLVRRVNKQFLNVALYSVIEIAVFCSSLELLIRWYSGSTMMISWSAIVVTVCIIIIITLVTVISKKRLRNAVRRRLHF